MPRKLKLLPKPARPSGNTGLGSDAPPSRRQQRLRAKHAVILDAALGLFSRGGLHGTTVEQIADASDISKANLFYYFPSKEDVYVAVLRRLMDEWLEPLRSMDAGMDPSDAIGDYIRRKVEFSHTHPEASRLFCLEIVQGAPLIGPALNTSLRELVDEKARVIQAWIREGKIADIDPHHLLFALWAITQHYADFASQVKAVTGRGLHERSYRQRVIESIQAIVLGGILPRTVSDTSAHPEPPPSAPKVAKPTIRIRSA